MACPAHRFALQRRSVGMTVGLPCYSYTAILRRLLCPKAPGPPANEGVSATALTAAGAAALRVACVGATSKRVKTVVQALSDSDRAAVAAAVARQIKPYPVPLHRAEYDAQAAFPVVWAMWCRGCETWRAGGTAPGPKRKRGAQVMIDLRVPGAGYCSVCPAVRLQPARLNGYVIGQIRLCSACGAVADAGRRPLGDVTVCSRCFAARPPRLCAVCGMAATAYVMARGATALVDVWLCKQHHPGKAAFDPVTTTADELIRHLR